MSPTQISQASPRWLIDQALFSLRKAKLYDIQSIRHWCGWIHPLPFLVASPSPTSLLEVSEHHLGPEIQFTVGGIPWVLSQEEQEAMGRNQEKKMPEGPCWTQASSSGCWSSFTVISYGPWLYGYFCVWVSEKSRMPGGTGWILNSNFGPGKLQGLPVKLEAGELWSW